MAVMSKIELKKLMEDKKLSFEPMLDQYQLQPVAIDLRVGNNFYIPKLWDVKEEGRVEFHINHINNSEKNEVLDCIHLDFGQYFTLLPGEFILISSLERVSLSSGEVMATLYPRSSTTRRGLSIDSGVIDPYYDGHLTIPILNQTRTQTIRIYPGERLVQLVFFELKSPISPEDAQSHGLAKPKYQNTKAYQLDYKFDPHEEINFIKEGEISKLKKKFPVVTEEDNDQEKDSLSVSAGGEKNSSRF